jgi:CDP-diacylglycerol--glycerol-3-phosphate 3-phosphatidyltransferase
MVANFFSILRIALIPFVLHSLKRDVTGVPTTALILLLVAILSDAADGYAARRFDQISLIGKILDPVADKLLIGSAGFALVWWYGFPLWLMGMLTCRDLVILASGLHLLWTRRIVIPANRFGKYTTVCMATAGVCHLIPVPESIRNPLLYMAAVLIAVSSVSYIRTLYNLHTTPADTLTVPQTTLSKQISAIPQQDSSKRSA